MKRGLLALWMLVGVTMVAIPEAVGSDAKVPIYRKPLLTFAAHSQFNHWRDFDTFDPRVTEMRFSRLDDLGTSGYDRAVRVWHRHFGSPMRCDVNLKHIVTCFAFSDEEEIPFVARGGRHDYDVPKSVAGLGPLTRTEGCVYIVNLHTNDTSGIIVTDRGSASSVDFSRNGKQLAIGTDQGTCELWETTGRLLSSFDYALVDRHILSHSSNPEPVHVRFSPVKNELFATSGTKEVKVWCVKDEVPVASLPGVKPAVFSPDGKYLAFQRLGEGHEIEIWDAGSHKCDVVLKPDIPYLKSIERHVTTFGRGGLAFSSDGRLLAQGFTRVVAVWNVPERKIIALLDAHPAEGAVVHLAFAREPMLLATAWDRGPDVSLWDLRNIKQTSNTSKDGSVLPNE